MSEKVKARVYFKEASCGEQAAKAHSIRVEAGGRKRTVARCLDRFTLASESFGPDSFRLRPQVVEQRVVVVDAVDRCELLVRQPSHTAAIQRHPLLRTVARALRSVGPCVRCKDHQGGATCGSPSCQMQGGNASQ